MQPPIQKNRINKEQKKSMMDAVYKYVPYWPVFLILLVVSLFGAWFYLRITPKQYESSASIMIKDESKGTYNPEMMKEMDQVSGTKIIENEIEVLQSKTLMSDVVKHLHLYASFYEDGEMAPKPAYTTSPVTIEAADPDALKKAEKVEFSFSAKDSQVVIGSKRYPLNQFVATNYGNLKFVPNKRFATKAENQLYFTLKSARSATGGFASKLKVAGSKVSTVISLKYRDEVPERGEDILGELITVYNKVSIEDKNKIADSTFAFLEQRLQIVGAELQEIERKAQAYKSSKGAVNISEQGALILKSQTETGQKTADVDMQLSILNQVEKYIHSKDNNASITPSTLGLSDPILTDLLTKLNEKELYYEKMKKTTGENNPVLTSLKSEIEKLRPSVMDNIQSQRASLQASKLNLNSTNNSFNTALESIPEKEKELIEINRDLAIKNSIYSFLLQKREASALAISANFEFSRIVEKPQAIYVPVSPKSSMIYGVAFIFSLALPIGFISVKGMLNRKIIFRQEIETLTSFPIIGEIMLDKSKDPLVIQEGKRTFIAEQFRRIRTSLAYLGVSHAGKKRVLVTSSLSGEGKSFVALNLALSLAMTGKKVILLELDLANPSLSLKLGVNYEQGVSDYLMGECEPEEVIKRTTANNNLFFLPCGKLPDNPSELLMNDRLPELLKYLEDIFDHVIIDSAPASLLSDAYVLSPMCHATLYVVKHKFTPKVYLERLEQETSVSQLLNVGIIFNGIRSRGFTKNGYGYGYGYGYIHNNSNKQKKTKKASK
jgi:tyrosine-protein kinase Etk/Wzc